MTKHLEIDGGRLAYEVHGGDGPLIVASPGMGDVRQVYRFVGPALAEAGYRFVAVDPRGAGESSVGWGDYSDAAVAGDMIALVEHLGGPAVLMGNSFSAGSAVIAAAERPDLVSSLVLIGPFARPVEVPTWMKLAFRLMLAPPWGRQVWTGYYRSKLYPSAKPEDFDSYVTNLSRRLAEPGRMQAFRGFASDDHSGAGARLDQVQAPTLIVMGTEDPDFADPAAEARTLAERLSARIEMVEGGGHYPQAEFPGRVVEAVTAFLSDLRA